MSSKEKNTAIIMKYININAHSAHLKIEGFEGVFPSWFSQGINAFSVHKVKCIQSPQCRHTVYGYYLSGEMPAPDYSNFVIPPLCGEHLLEAVKALDELLVQALLSLDQKIENQSIVRQGQHPQSPSFTEHQLVRTKYWGWFSQPLKKAKNRME